MTKMNSQMTKTKIKIKTKTLQNDSRDEDSSLENHNCATTHVTRKWTDPYSFVKKSTESGRQFQHIISVSTFVCHSVFTDVMTSREWTKTDNRYAVYRGQQLIKGLVVLGGSRLGLDGERQTLEELITIAVQSHLACLYIASRQVKSVASLLLSLLATQWHYNYTLNTYSRYIKCQ